MRYAPNHIPAVDPDGVLQNRCRGEAVDVVISEYDNSFPSSDRPDHTSDSTVEVPKSVWVQDVIPAQISEAGCQCGRAGAAGIRESGQVTGSMLNCFATPGKFPMLAAIPIWLRCLYQRVMGKSAFL